jgi:RHS repeat-associated protein
MLSAVERPDGDVVTFAYDALGRRITKTYRGKTTNWIWDGNVPLHEWIDLTEEARARDGEPLRTSFEREIAQARRKAYLSRRTAQGPPELVYPTLDGGGPGKAGAGKSGTGTSNARDDADAPLLEGTPESPITWLFEPESFSPLGKLVDDERYSIITDHLGTPRAMFDAHGQEVWAADLDTYGQLREVRGGRKACPFRFPGQCEDSETGLYYNRFRYYDPEVGGYVSQDPIGLAGGLRPRAYVRDPLVEFDPLGLSSCKTTDSRVGPPSHIADFRLGASVFLPESVYRSVRTKFAALGRSDGLFVLKTSQAERLHLSGDNAAIRHALGIPDSSAAWHEPLVRIDIPDPLSHNPRMASGLETGANELFKPGGYTSGGVQEMVTDPIPWDKVSVSGPFGGGT